MPKKVFLFLFVFSFIVNLSTAQTPLNKLKIKAKEAYSFCKKKKYNTNFCMLADMSIHSGKKRFFIWSFTKDTIIDAGLVSHGCGEATWSLDETKEAPVFSNTHGSYCSSLGKYKIGKRGWSNWGIHVNYQLHGLEKTNSNALDRLILMHSWELIPDKELYPYGTPEGWGCPAVSNRLMRVIDKKLKASRKPVLLWMYQ